MTSELHIFLIIISLLAFVQVTGNMQISPPGFEAFVRFVTAFILVLAVILFIPFILLLVV